MPQRGCAHAGKLRSHVRLTPPLFPCAASQDAPPQYNSTRLLVRFEDAALDALKLLPPLLRKYATSQRLESSGMQVCAHLIFWGGKGAFFL